MQTLGEVRRTQPQAVEPLLEALRGGRLHHAYVLSGARGAPLTTVAQALCASLLCPQAGPGADACGTCAACRKMAGHNHPDVVDGHPSEKGTYVVGAIRALTARLALRPAEAPLTVVRLHQADGMGPAAQNALLKTLEEPPGATLFLLLTHRPAALLATVRSRAVHLRLRPPDPLAVAERLGEAGVDARLTQTLAAALGDDGETAQGWQSAGLTEVWDTLRAVLDGSGHPSQVFAAAAALGADKAKLDIALVLLEVVVRDSLAARYGAAPLLEVAPRGNVAAAAQALQRLRRLQANNINRVMALESVLLPLSGVAAR